MRCIVEELAPRQRYYKKPQPLAIYSGTQVTLYRIRVPAFTLSQLPYIQPVPRPSTKLTQQDRILSPFFLLIEPPRRTSAMKYFGSTLAFATAVAAHGYVNNATINNKDYTFYQPYQDPYVSGGVKRISRPIQGNGPVQDVTLSDIQCGGYTAGGFKGSSPAALHAEAEAGSEVKLYWTLWPDSHVGPTITYMARCPDTGCDKYMPESKYEKLIHCHHLLTTMLIQIPYL